MRRITSQTLLLFLSAITGCFTGVGGDVDANRIDPIEALKNRLSEVRGLAFTSEIPMLFETKESLKERLEAELKGDLGDKKREDLSLAYAKLGLLPAGVDLRGRLLSYYSSEAQGFYSSKTKQIVLLEGPKTPAISGREKKFQNHQDCKFCGNEIKYLQLLILEKWIFSHDLSFYGG